MCQLSSLQEKTQKSSNEKVSLGPHTRCLHTLQFPHGRAPQVFFPRPHPLNVRLPPAIQTPGVRSSNLERRRSDCSGWAMKRNNWPSRKEMENCFYKVREGGWHRNSKQIAAEPFNVGTDGSASREHLHSTERHNNWRKRKVRLCPGYFEAKLQYSRLNPRVVEKGDPSESIPVPFLYFTKKETESKRWNRFEVDKSTALLSFPMDTLTTDITERKEKRRCIWHVIIQCVTASDICFCFSALISPHFQRTRNLLSLFTEEWTLVPWCVMTELQG